MTAEPLRRSGPDPMSTETRDALREALAEALTDLEPDWPTTTANDKWADAILAHPAMVAALRATDASEGEAWVPPTPADLDQLLIEWWPLQRDEYVAYIVDRATDVPVAEDLLSTKEAGKSA